MSDKTATVHWEGRGKHTAGKPFCDGTHKKLATS